jgi:hypothetical protein
MTITSGSPPAAPAVPAPASGVVSDQAAEAVLAAATLPPVASRSIVGSVLRWAVGPPHPPLWLRAAAVRATTTP